MNTYVTARANTCLHLLFGQSSSSLRDCLAQVQSGDCLVLLNTATLLLLDTTWIQQLPADVRVCALDADVQAHGLAELQPTSGSELIDDDCWARLVMKHSHCLSWK